MSHSIDDMRRFAVTRSLFEPTTLKKAFDNMGFVQADPIRAPARAQDLTLRPRVKGYRAGDLERHYGRLKVEEDFFVTYGFVTAPLQALMHPRPDIAVSAWGGSPWPPARVRQARALLDFVRDRGEAHPREVDAHFAQGSVKNYWGGSSNATTHLLDGLHYRGLLRVARRDSGIRVYAARDAADARRREIEEHICAERIDRLVDAAVHLYAPLPGASLATLVRSLRGGVPQWRGDLGAALQRARQRLSHTRAGGTDWYWPVREKPPEDSPEETVRLLAPFDPVVRDRRRFEMLWGWEYRFEAYTPAKKRKLGYYALPLLWGDRIIGWGNISVKNGALAADLGYVGGAAPGGRAFGRALEAELERFREFLNL